MDGKPLQIQEARRPSGGHLPYPPGVLETLLATSPPYIYRYDLAENRFLFSNCELYRFLGYSESPTVCIRGALFWTLMHPDDAAEAAAFLERITAAADGEMMEMEIRLRHADGTYHWINNRGVVLVRDENGRALEALGVAQDVNARRIIEEQETRLVEIIESTPDVVATIRPDGALVYLNWAGRDLLGMQMNDISGLSLRDLFPEDQVEEMFRESIPAAWRVGFWMGEGSLQRHDGGQPVAVSLVITAHPSSLEMLRDPSPLGIQRESTNHSGQQFLSLIARDMSDLRRMEAELRASRDELEARVAERTAELQRSNEELGQFAYVASHDLQEPLRMVTNFAQLFERRYKDQLDARGEKYLGYIAEGAQRVQQLVDGLLKYSRVGAQGLNREPVDCNRVVEQVLSALRLAIRDNHAAVKAENLPVIQGDESQIFQLFQNLIGNAIKFHGKDAPQVRIWAERVEGTLEKAGEWKISVADNGISIEPQFAERVFVIFQRLHSREDYPGMGVGLAVCKKIVQQHGGKIWLESKVGEGATFFFTIPDHG